MDESSRWKIIIAKRFRRQLPLDVEYCSPIALRAIILDVHTPSHTLDRIAQVYCDNEEILHDLVLCPNLDESTLAFIALTASDEIRGFITSARVMEVVLGDDKARGKTEPETHKKKLNIMQQIQRMTMSQKIKLAMSGAKEARGLLIRESSKIIAMGVLSNPKLTIGEVEFFSKSTNLSEDVIRKIGTNIEWTRKPAVVSALVNNPKTPVGISLGFIPRMSVRELGILEQSRNVPEAVRTAARNLLIKKKLGKA
jgi:hypothetical protein